MQLIENTQEHHLPEDPSTADAIHIKLLKRFWQAISSKRGQTLMIGMLLFVICTVILSIHYLGSSKYIDKHGISLQNVYANRVLEVIDPEETARKTERAKQRVSLIFKDKELLNQYNHQNINHLIDDLTLLTSNSLFTKSTSSDQHQKRLEDFLKETPESKTLVTRLVKRNPGAEYWHKISLIAHATTNRILDKGLTLDDYLNKRELIIGSAIPPSLSHLDRDTIYFIINASLQPNLVLDEAAMGQKREEAAVSVEAATHFYQPGERIVTQGERVTQLQVNALEKMGKAVIGKNWVACLGVAAITLIFTLTLWAYLYYFDNKAYFTPSYACLISVLMITTISIFQVLYSNLQMQTIEETAMYAIPMAAMTLILSIFTHPRIGTMTTILTVFLVGLTLKLDFGPLSVLLFGSVIGVYILSRRMNFRDRGQLMYAGLYISFSNVFMIFALHMLDSVSLWQNQWSTLFSAMGWGFLSGIISGILTIGALPFLESLFGLITPYTLMELANHDHPLLRRLQFEAPGTFHHSLMVASLSEAAAESIGANTLLTRVGCLYHDIGKMKRPLFFIENQAYFGADNPHDKLTPRLSKMVITAHPKDSIEMGKQYRLPEAVQRFMTEHHGTTMVGYFYNKAVQEEGDENVNKSQFRYPGPKPQSKETAIVMLADACESAVRALKAPTLTQIEERIDKLIWQRIDDGQFDQCPLTFRDIQRIKETFVRVLRGIQHNRIEYQQNILRDLGRKLPKIQTATTSDNEGPNPEKINSLIEQLRQSQNTGKKPAKEANQSDTPDPNNPDPNDDNLKSNHYS